MKKSHIFCIVFVVSTGKLFCMKTFYETANSLEKLIQEEGIGQDSLSRPEYYYFLQDLFEKSQEVISQDFVPAEIEVETEKKRYQPQIKRLPVEARKYVTRFSCKRSKGPLKDSAKRYEYAWKQERNTMPRCLQLRKMGTGRKYLDTFTIKPSKSTKDLPAEKK